MSYSKEEVLLWLSGIADGAIKLDLRNEEYALAAIDMIEGDADETDDDIETLEQLSPHFTLSELIYSATADARDIDNVPNDAEIDQLDLLANLTLEKVRTICDDKPVLISSGFRCKELNTCIGGASNSAHLFGAAADITIPQFGLPLDVCKALYPYLKELQIDQLIYETNQSGGAWVHIGRRPEGEPRHEAFSIVQGATSQHPFPG
jgi:hypothetical protein